MASSCRTALPRDGTSPSQPRSSARWIGLRDVLGIDVFREVVPDAYIEAVARMMETTPSRTLGRT